MLCGGNEAKSDVGHNLVTQFQAILAKTPLSL